MMAKFTSDLGWRCDWNPHDLNASNVKCVGAGVGKLVEPPVHVREAPGSALATLQRGGQSTNQGEVVVVARLPTTQTLLVSVSLQKNSDR